MSLGAFYSKGTGVEKDYEKSFKCYKAAADQGICNTGYFICLAEQYVLLAEILIIGRKVNLR